jgi:hypothetical protein
MTGQVKEEILTRWGELGLRVKRGRLHIEPLLLDAAELPDGGELRFTWGRVPFAYRRAAAWRVRVQRGEAWSEGGECGFDMAGVTAVEVHIGPGTP